VIPARSFRSCQAADRIVPVSSMILWVCEAERPKVPKSDATAPMITSVMLAATSISTSVKPP